MRTLLALASGCDAIQLVEPIGEPWVELRCLDTEAVVTVQVDDFRFGVIVLLHDHMLLQRNRAFFRDDEFRLAAHGGDPTAEILDVGHRRGQCDDTDALR